MEIGVVIARIIGIYLIARGLTVLAQWLPVFFQGFSGSSVGPYVGPLSVGLVLIGGGLLFLTNAASLSQKLFSVERISMDVESDKLQLISLRILGLWLLFEAMGHLLTGSVSSIAGLMLGPPQEAGDAFSIDYFRTQNLVRAVTSGFAALVQGSLGLWILLRPESLIARIDRSRASRSSQPIEEEVQD